MRIDLSIWRLAAAGSVGVATGAVVYQLSSAGLVSAAVFGLAVGWIFTSGVLSTDPYSEADDEEGSA